MAARTTLQSYLKAPKTPSLANAINKTRTIATFKVPTVNNEPNVRLQILIRLNQAR
jgi:1-pyrroline-5-carboxylate dehydrogenase